MTASPTGNPRVGLVIPNYGRDAVTAVRDGGVAAEGWGYHPAWLTDHVVGIPSQRATTAMAWADCLVGLTHLAARTTSLLVGTSVLVAPYRNPVITAKALATLDRLSGGRLVVGVGTGWSRAEFAALGRAPDYARRGELTDEYLRTWQRCWKGGAVELPGDGDRRFHFAPAPVRTNGPPLLIGGSAPASLRRAARLGAGWHPAGRTPGEVRKLGARVDGLAGRPVARIPRVRVTTDDVDEIAGVVSAYGEAGCAGVVLEFLPSRRGSGWTAVAGRFAARRLRNGRLTRPRRVTAPGGAESTGPSERTPT